MKSDKHNVTNIINDLNKKVKEEVKEEVKVEVKVEEKEKERNMQKLLEDMHKTIMILIASNNKHMEFIQEIMKKVVVVEDENRLRESIIEILEMEGYETFAASNGKEGLHEIQKNNPEVITLAIGDGANDVNMITAAHIGRNFFIKF
jgi:PleD family two-component response regulator